MIPDDVVRLPAGWYPDPTGLPQLRWWDNHAWTQHTTAARQPLIVQESPLAWADDLPTRRERREREREDRSTDDLTPPTAQSLLELAPPSEDDEPADQPAPDDTDNSNGTDDSNRDASSYVPLSATGHAGRIHSVPPLEDDGDGSSDDPPAPARRSYASQQSQPIPTTMPTTMPQAAPSTAGTPLFDQIAAGITDTSAARQPGARHPDMQNAGLSAVPTSTVAVWVMALFPLLQLVVVLLLVTGFGSSAGTELLMPVMLVVIYLAMVALAFGDYRTLRRSGIAQPAHWAWSLLTAPVYLFVRATVLTRSTGRGFGPVLVWFALALLSVASVLAVPGMLITSVPTVFSAQAEQSVAADAAANGATLEVDCPAAPPILVGQSFSCTGTTDNGKSYEIEVSLQRVNGWIDWRVDDWGINTLSR